MALTIRLPMRPEDVGDLECRAPPAAWMQPGAHYDMPRRIAAPTLLHMGRRAGYSCAEYAWRSPVRSAPSSEWSCGPEGPGSCECRCPAQEDASRTHDASCAG